MIKQYNAINLGTSPPPVAVIGASAANSPFVPLSRPSAIKIAALRVERLVWESCAAAATRPANVS
jgi:hypothetical protein